MMTNTAQFMQSSVTPSTGDDESRELTLEELETVIGGRPAVGWACYSSGEIYDNRWLHAEPEAI